MTLILMAVASGLLVAWLAVDASFAARKYRRGCSEMRRHVRDVSTEQQRWREMVG